MEKQEWMQRAAQTILDADETEAIKVAEESLAAGMDPLEMINQGFSEGIRKMGDLFDRGEVFLPTLIIASEGMVKAVKILEAALPDSADDKKQAIVVIGTIEGDVHDIGKGIVATMLRVYGFEVHDLGRDVPIEKYVEKAIETNADFVGSSALMTTTQPGQKKLEAALKEAGIRDKVKTMVGGAVATEHWQTKIGADIYAESAGETVMKLNEIIN
jgi:corrinoid protein of di/trimethylamine methyltransferase